MDPTNQNNTGQEVAYDQNAADLTPEPTSSFPKKKIISLAIGIVVVLIVIIVVFAFFVIPKPSDEKGANLTYWGVWEDPVVFQQIIKEYEAKHPGVKITYEKQDIKFINAGYIAFLYNRIKSGTGPDIFRYHNTWVNQLYTSQLLMPLPKDVVESTGLKDHTYPFITLDLNRNGAYYGVPLGVDTLALFVNDDIVKAGGYDYPTDWDYLLNLSRLVTVVDETSGEIKTSGLAMGTYDNVDHAGDIISLLFAQSGVNLMDLVSGDATKVASAKNKITEAFEYYTCFARNDDICQKVWDDQMENSKLAFAKGKVAMYFGYSWDMYDIKTINPQLNYSIHPVPHLENRNQTVASYWVEGVSSNTKYPKSAFDFLAYLGSKEVLEKLYGERTKQLGIGTVYPRTDQKDLLKNNQQLAAFTNQANVAVSSSLSSDTFDGEGADNHKLNGYLATAIIDIVDPSKNKSPQSAAEAFIQGVQQVLGKYVPQKTTK